MNSQDMPTVDKIRVLAAEFAFGRPLVTNVVRGLLVEAMVAKALGATWRWCSADYAPFDFEHSGGRTRLEVKQSARRQPWRGPPSEVRWDIAARTGFYENERWIARPDRNADIYILAAHLVADRPLADHRSAGQWLFYVVAATRLPPSKSIGQAAVEGFGDAVPLCGLAEAVERARQEFESASRVGPAGPDGQDTVLSVG